MSPRNATEIGKQRFYTLPDGSKVPSVTTILNVLDKPWMGPWAAKLVATEAVDNRAWWSELARDEAISYLKGLPFRKRDEAADFGTAVHEVAEAIAADLPFTIPANAEGHIAALHAWYEMYRPEVLAVETQVAGLGYAGTFDLLARVYEKTYLIDLKTGKTLDPKWRLQVAAYMQGEPFRDEAYLDWPAEPDDGAVLWVPSDRPEEWQFLALGLGPDDYFTFDRVAAVHRWTQTYKKDTGMTLVLPQSEEPTDD
jgi:hypothetical protein